MSKHLFVAALGMVLCGCVAAPEVTTPPALVRIHLPAKLGQDETSKLSVIDSCERDVPSSRELASDSSDPAKLHPLGGGQGITLHFERSLAGKSTCDTYTRVVFEPGKRYSIYLGGLPAGLPGLPGLSVSGACALIAMGETAGQISITEMTSACER